MLPLFAANCQEEGGPEEWAGLAVIPLRQVRARAGAPLGKRDLERQIRRRDQVLRSAGFALGAWLSPGMIRSVGHIRAYAGYAGGAAALTLMLSLGDHFLWWLITRFGFGICAAGLFAVAESWIADATPSERVQHLLQPRRRRRQ